MNRDTATRRDVVVENTPENVDRFLKRFFDVRWRDVEFGGECGDFFGTQRFWRDVRKHLFNSCLWEFCDSGVREDGDCLCSGDWLVAVGKVGYGCDEYFWVGYLGYLVGGRDEGRVAGVIIHRGLWDGFGW